MSYDWVHTTHDRVIATAPGWIGSVIIVPSADNKKGACTIYDGESAQDPQIVTVYGLSGETKQLLFVPPLKTKRGLYVDVGGDTEQVLIQYDWGDE